MAVYAQVEHLHDQPVVPYRVEGRPKIESDQRGDLALIQPPQYVRLESGQSVIHRVAREETELVRKYVGGLIEPLQPVGDDSLKYLGDTVQLRDWAPVRNNGRIFSRLGNRGDGGMPPALGKVENGDEVVEKSGQKVDK